MAIPEDATCLKLNRPSRPPDPAQLVQTAPTPSGSASVASTSADSAVPSAQLGGLSIRPRLLGRASTANPSAASSSNAKNVRAALFAAQSVSQGPDPAEVLVKASSRLKRFNDLAQKVVPTEPSDIKALEARLRSGTSALESARQAFQALAELNIKNAFRSTISKNTRISWCRSSQSPHPCTSAHARR